MSSTARPTRNRNQPPRNKDNIELNLQLIQRLEANKPSKGGNNCSTNYAKLLATFINSVNQSRDISQFQDLRASKLKIYQQKKDQSVSKAKSVPVAQTLQSKTQREKKKYIVGSGSKGLVKTSQGPIAQQHMQIEKNINEGTKITRNGRGPIEGENQNIQQNSRAMGKQGKKVAVLSPAPQAHSMLRKPFKRSSYHIAIAYSIYMGQIKEKNPTLVPDANNCDPTIFAKRLKMGKIEN